jgi:hypothetical protein
MDAKEYFDENLSGEPLTESSVIEALEEYSSLSYRDKLIEIAESMGFTLDNDAWDKETGLQYLRFVLPEDLHEYELTWVCLRQHNLATHLKRGSEILFKAGQKAKINQINNKINFWK